jgi:hypothetical protein
MASGRSRRGSKGLPTDAASSTRYSPLNGCLGASGAYADNDIYGVLHIVVLAICASVNPTSTLGGLHG